MRGFAFNRLQAVQVDAVNAAKALAFKVDHIVIIFAHHGNNIQIHARSHHHAVVMVGMVAAQFGAAGGRINAQVTAFTEAFFKLLNGLDIALALGVNHSGIVGVKAAKDTIEFSGLDSGYQLFRSCHDKILLKCLKGLCGAVAMPYKIFYTQFLIL